jgi:hypothetical protein
MTSRNQLPSRAGQFTVVALLASLFVSVALHAADPLAQEPNTWVKRSPTKDGPVSPGMGYETSFGYDPIAKRLIRWGGHNQGGGGEQNAETWVYDPATAKWEHKEPNLSPPGVCCAQQNVFAESAGRFLRFSAFSGSHGWQWFREIYLNNNSVWSYDLATNTWRDMRPLPAPRLAPLRCAAWDTDHQVAVVFGGEGSTEGTIVYDPHANTWTRKKPAKQPDFRSGGNMAYDSANRLHILFGSQFSNDQQTWAYDLSKNEWRDLAPAMQPPTDRNDAVLAYDSVNQVVVALVRVVDEREGDEVKKAHLETWAFDATKNTWTKMNPAREPDGWGNRRNVMAFIPDQNLVLLEHYANPTERIPGVDREQQIWTYRYAETKGRASVPAPRVAARPEPRIVEDVVVSVVSLKEARLTWKPPPGQDIAGYHVERAAVDVLSEDQILRLKKDTPPLAEPSVGAVRAIGPFTRLTKSLLKEASFTDESLDLAKPEPLPEGTETVRRFQANQLDAAGKPYRYAVYAYRIRAVNDAGVESGPSPWFLTIPSSPQSLFAKEAGTECHLKWAPSSEQKLLGYRVYRMEGPKINGPGQKVTRLADEPIAEPRFTDAAATKDTKRYWVVAVDALGQEGFPSAPAWHYRQYRDYYKPFVGEWHQ